MKYFVCFCLVISAVSAHAAFRGYKPGADQAKCTSLDDSLKGVIDKLKACGWKSCPNYQELDAEATKLENQVDADCTWFD